MKIIIAPAKKMIVDTDSFPTQSEPVFLNQTDQILNKLQSLTYTQAKKLWQCSDKIARPNYEWLKKIDLRKNLTPAVLAYSGIQYQYMAPDLFTAPALDYIQRNLRILSGFYGILKPFDGIVPYRLEMQSSLSINNTVNLYQFWRDQIYNDLDFDNNIVVNLASQEYSKSVSPFLKPGEQLIDVVFGSLVDGKVKVKATLAKMARGEMIRYMAEHQVKVLSELKKFDHPDYKFSSSLSNDQKLVFSISKINSNNRY